MNPLSKLIVGKKPKPTTQVEDVVVDNNAIENMIIQMCSGGKKEREIES